MLLRSLFEGTPSAPRPASRKTIIKPSTPRTYLPDIRSSEAKEAKKRGARWDKEKRSWYAPKRDTAKKIVSSSSAVKSEHQKQRELNVFASGLRYQSLFGANQVDQKIGVAVEKALTKTRTKIKNTGLEL